MHLLKFNCEAKTLAEVPPGEFAADSASRYFYVQSKRVTVPISTPDGIGEIVWQHPDYQPPSPANAMTDQHQHRAEPETEPEQWYQCASALIERLSRLEEGYDELTARMEQIESTQHSRVTGLSDADIKAAELEWARTAPGMRSDDLRAASATNRQQLTLVERTAELLAAAFSRSRPGDCLLPLARAMLREVAAGVIDWQDSYQLVRTGWEAGKWLEQEANR